MKECISIDAEDKLHRDVADEYSFKAHADVGNSLAMGNTTTTIASAIA